MSDKEADKETADRYRKRAEELRTLAALPRYARVRALALAVAHDHDRLADAAEGATLF